MSHLFEDLHAEIARGRVLVIVGSGVSLGATNNNPFASWTGLLESGVQRCAEIVSSLPTGWAERVRAELKSSDMDEVLSAAEKISRKLGGPIGPEWRRWLRETVGSLKASNCEVIKALAALKVPIGTTNYDALIEEVTGLQWLTWQDGTRVERMLQGDDPGVLHLHGFWDKPESVVLGIRSYETVLGDSHFQTILKAIRTMRTLLFVGCGAGLGDPNLGGLLSWSREIFAESESRHFRLARDSEVAELQKQHPPEERIFVLGFGADHRDLAPFLGRLAPPSDPVHPSLPTEDLHQFIIGKSDIDRRLAELEAKRASLPAGGYLRELSRLAFELWDLGRKRRAWWLLKGWFTRDAAALNSEERLEIGTKLAEMMLDDDMARSAVPVLKTIIPDAERLPGKDAKLTAFWQVQSRCWVDVCAYDQAISAINRAIEVSGDVETKDRLHAELAEIHLLQGETDRALALVENAGSAP